ncbi:MAG: winged helix-turn-helix domain-containing protein [Ferroplasma sp.]
MDFPDEPQRILWWLLVATRGGNTRIHILNILKENPENLNKIATSAGINYRTAEHHIKVLLDNGIIKKEGKGYGCIYFIADYYCRHFDLIEKIIESSKTK